MIAYGDRARLGVLVPSGNTVAEPELRAMLPPEVSLVVTRLPLRGSSEAELLGMAGSLETAAGLLADAQPDAIAFHCTAVTTFDPALAEDLRRRIEAATGLPALATSDALLAAVAALGGRRVLLVTPYIEAVHAREVAFGSERRAGGRRELHGDRHERGDGARRAIGHRGAGPCGACIRARRRPLPRELYRYPLRRGGRRAGSGTRPAHRHQ
jgi:Arylmalonate decarboxylase